MGPPFFFMEITEDQFNKLRREAESAKAEAERAKGALSQITAQLKEQFGCDTIQEAKAKLAELNKAFQEGRITE